MNKLWVLPGLLFAVSVYAEQRVAFVTSVSGNGDLSSWSDAGSNTGLAAGDAICQARAAAGGLANAENFVALLSDSTDDAYCRLTGHSGKKADLCGQASLPSDAGPWVNTLGENLAESLPEMLFPELIIYRTLNENEFGEVVNSRYFTGSFSDGELSSAERVCDDWRSNSGTISGGFGSSNATGTNFFNSGAIVCNFSLRLACFETVAGDPLVSETPLGSLVFVTDETGNGDLSSWPSAGGEVGIDAADNICQTAALNAGLEQPEAFVAWISDDSVNAIDRLEYNGPWFRQDGVVVAHDLDELTSGQLNAPNNLSESMRYISSTGVWTGTQQAGIGSAENCQNWQDGTDMANGTRGTANSIISFSGSLAFPCDFSFLKLHCFHNVDIDLIFSNDFE